MKLICNGDLLGKVIKYYNFRDDICPFEGSFYQRKIDLFIAAIVPRLRSFASVAVDDLAADIDFSVSSFSDPGHYFSIVGSGDFEPMAKGLEVISSTLNELDLSIITCLDCGVYYYCDRYGNYFLDPCDSEPEHLAEFWNMPYDALVPHDREVELLYQSLTKQLVSPID